MKQLNKLDCLSMSGSWLHSVGAIYWKHPWLNVLSLARGSSKLELADFSVLVGWYDCSMLHIYDGASSFRAL